MNETQLLTELKKFKANHQQEYGIEVLGIFGSYERGETGHRSDVDIVVRLTKQDLEEALHVSVDVVSYRPTMDYFLKKRIDRDAVYV